MPIRVHFRGGWIRRDSTTLCVSYPLLLIPLFLPSHLPSHLPPPPPPTTRNSAYSACINVLLQEWWVELLVPVAVERHGDVEPLAVQTQLDHLGAARDPTTFDKERLGLAGQLLVLSHLDWTVGHDGPSQEHLGDQGTWEVPGYESRMNISQTMHERREKVYGAPCESPNKELGCSFLREF